MGQSNYKPSHRRTKVGRSFNGRRAIDMMYDHVWEAYRKRYLEINPRCYACGLKATTVDHLIPHQGDEKLFKKLNNHIPLCEICHNKVTAIFDKKHRAGMPVDNKIIWMQAKRAEKDLTFKVKVLPSYP